MDGREGAAERRQVEGPGEREPFARRDLGRSRGGEKDAEDSATEKMVIGIHSSESCLALLRVVRAKKLLDGLAVQSSWDGGKGD